MQAPVQEHTTSTGNGLMTGAEIKQATGVPPERQLLLVRSEGPRLVRDNERIEVMADDQFEGVVNWRYGSRHRSRP